MALRASIFLIAGLVLAQPPDNVKLDTPQARAVLVTAEPHHSTPLRDSTFNRVLVTVSSGEIRWTPAGQRYTIDNSTSQPIRIIAIELKNKPPRPPLPDTQLDPTLVDSQHYKVEFENDQVRVLRVRYGPREAGARHEHILNRVVCYITDQANGKAGDVHISGAMTHSEENTLDRPVERIAVELK